MKQAKIEIKVTAYVNGKEVECELSSESKIIISGNLIINEVTLQADEPNN